MIILPQSEMLKYKAWIKTLDEKNTNECRRIVQKTANMIVSRAKTFADFPGKWSHGFLRASIGITGYSKTGLAVEIGAGEARGMVNYAPYVEFGTGTKVKVNEDTRDYAWQFKGKGIRKVNLLERPYFFPAVRIGVKGMINELNRMGFK
jgi:hypothetical protein